MAISLVGDTARSQYATTTSIATTTGIDTDVGDLVVVAIFTSATLDTTGVTDTAGNDFSGTIRDQVVNGSYKLQVAYVFATAANAANKFTWTWATSSGAWRVIMAFVFRNATGLWSLHSSITATGISAALLTGVAGTDVAECVGIAGGYSGGSTWADELIDDNVPTAILQDASIKNPCTWYYLFTEAGADSHAQATVAAGTWLVDYCNFQTESGGGELDISKTILAIGG